MKEIELGKVCQFINGDRGKNYPSRSDFKELGIPFINAGNLKDWAIESESLNFISEEKYNQLSSGKLKPNDILFCLRGSLGKFALNKDGIQGAIASSLVILRPSSDLDVHYLKNYLKSERLKRIISSAEDSSSQPNLSATSVKKFLIPLPSLEEQKAIVAKLDRAQRLIDIDKEMLAKYDQLIQSIFLDMFGDPITNPKGWEVKRLKNISTAIGSGNTPKGGKKVYVEHGVLFLRSQNVWRNRLELDDVAFIDNETHESMKKSSLKNGDILMTKTGRFNTENSSLGRAAMYRGKDDGANLNGHVYLIRLKEGINNDFVLYILITEQYRDYIRRVCVGGIDKRQINKTHLEEFPIISPPLNLQQKFTETLQRIELQKEQVQISLKKSEDLFSSLVQEVFG